MSRTIWLIGILVILALVLGVPCAAQTSTSRISGTVTDVTGAIVPGATVTAKNEATGVTYTQVSTEVGVFAFPSLPVGAYTVTVELQGFKTVQISGNILEINTPLVVKVALQVGGVSEVISVQGGYEKLESSSAKIGNIVEQKAIEALPLNGRNPLSLIVLEPGVVQGSSGAGGSGININGSRDRAFNVTIDGIDANESSVPNPMSNLYRLNPDNVQEFRVVTSNATPEEGRNSGANMSIATRSGTGQFHATAFEFFRNTALNSNEFYANSQTAPDPRTGKAPRPDIKMHQFGAEGGGPILKSRTFFFASYQNQRIKTTQPIDQTFGIPIIYSPTLMTGNYRYFVADPTVPFRLNGQTITRNSPLLVDGKTGALNSGVPLCSSTLLTNCVASYNIFANDPKGIGIDPTISTLFKSYPQPNNFTFGDGLNTGTYLWNPPTDFQGPNILGRLDHKFNENNNVFVRYLWAHYNTLKGDPLNGRPQVFPGFPPLGEVFRNTSGLAVNYRRVISPTIVNDFTLGFSRFVFLFTQGEANPKWPNGNPPYSFANVSLPFINTPRTYRAITTPQFVDNLSMIKGKHAIQLGLNVRLYEHNDQRGQPGGTNVTPTLSFSGSTRTPPGFVTPSVASSTRAGINSTDNTRLLGSINDLSGIPAQLSQFFLGNLSTDSYLPYKIGDQVTLWNEGHRLKQYNFYLQDEWKFRPNITLNYGLRWEVNLAPTEAGGRVYVPDKPVDGSQGPVTFVHTDRWLKTNNLGAVAPRLAIAWSPRGNTKTVVRAGYGIYFDPLNSFQVTAVSGKVPGLVTNCTSVVGGATTPGCVAPPDLRIGQGFPQELSSPTVKPSSFLTLPAQLYGTAPTLTTFDPYTNLPTVHQWNLSIQRELPLGLVVQGAYVGHRGTRLMRTYNMNQINSDSILPSFLIMQKNNNLGCQPDGTGCPAGVTGTPVPIVTNGSIPASLVSTIVNNSTTKGFLANNAAGSFAQRIEQNTLNLKLRPNQQFTTITYLDSGGDSYYHGFQTTVRKRFEKGLLFGLAYTYQKSMDDQSVDPVGATSGGALSTTGARGATDIRNWRIDRARSDFDRTTVLTLNSVYELPLGRSKWLGSNLNGPLNQVLGGWSVNSIYTWMSGSPFTVTSGTFTANNSHTSRAALVGAQPEMKFAEIPGVVGPVYFPNASAFKIPDPGSYGIGRNTFEAQPYWNLDLGITKKFYISERTKVDFRMEMFNALNHPNFDNPRDASVGSPSILSSLFAQSCCRTVAPPSTQTVIQTGESARIIQFALKLSF